MCRWWFLTTSRIRPSSYPLSLPTTTTHYPLPPTTTTTTVTTTTPYIPLPTTTTTQYPLHTTTHYPLPTHYLPLPTTTHHYPLPTTHHYHYTVPPTYHHPLPLTSMLGIMRSATTVFHTSPCQLNLYPGCRGYMAVNMWGGFTSWINTVPPVSSGEDRVSEWVSGEIT